MQTIRICPLCHAAIPMAGGGIPPMKNLMMLCLSCNNVTSHDVVEANDESQSAEQIAVERQNREEYLRERESV